VSSVILRGLTKRYGDLTVLDNVSLAIEHGQLVCLLGPSGCGKTRALRLLAGLPEPTAGELAIGDRIVSSPKRSLAPEQGRGIFGGIGTVLIGMPVVETLGALFSWRIGFVFEFRPRSSALIDSAPSDGRSASHCLPSLHAIY